MKMNKKRLIIAGIIFLAGLLLRFGFSGHDFIAYGLFLVSVLIVVFGVVSRTLKQLIALLLAMGVVYFAIIEIPIIDEASGDGDFDADYLIVLGAAVRGDTPSRALVERMEAARAYLLSHPDAVAIVSGGQGDGENLSEAEAMYKWLTANGIDGSRLIIEDRATSTYENLKYSFDIINSRGQEQDISIAVVTSEYHIYRAKLLADSLGAEVGGIPAKTSAPAVKLNYFIREAFGVTYQWIFG